MALSLGRQKTSDDPRFHEIARERVSDRIAQEILKLIASGELAPGERLPGERQLAEMMGVSRVSIRAALQQLKAQGYIKAIQGGGTRVVAAQSQINSALAELASANEGNLRDLAQIRASLEAWAAYRAAERATPEQIEEIDHWLAVMSAPDRPERHKSEDDYNFHLAIAKASGSTIYQHLLSALGEALEESIAHNRLREQANQDHEERFLEDHRRIAAAIRNREPKAAEAAMADHLASIIELYGL